MPVAAVGTAPAWTATKPQPQWNGKVLYTYGASTGQPRQQFRSEQNWAVGGITGINDDTALKLGFMVADNSITDSLYNSSRILVNETTMMMKEHIVANYGEIKYTMANGCSGGSIQQNTVASTYPGLLDGIQPSCDYPDSITTGIEVGDCVLLVNAYVTPEWTALMAGVTQAQIDAKKAAINGHRDRLGCHGWNNSFGFNNKPGNYVVQAVLTATGVVGPFGAAKNNCNLPAALVYDPVTNPTGTRCGDPDLAAAVWGTTTGLPGGTSKRAHDQRQRRRAVRPEGAARGDDHARGVRDPEREDRRRGRRLERDHGALARRYRGADHRLPVGHRLERQEPRQGRDHRFARLRRGPDGHRHPLQLAQLLRACTAR